MLNNILKRILLFQCGSSQESEGPDSPSAPPVEEHKTEENEMKIEAGEELEAKTEVEDETEESEVEEELKTDTVKEEVENNEMGFEEHSIIKNEIENEDKEDLQNSEGGEQSGSAASIATKRKVSCRCEIFNRIYFK